jgi:alpha-D-ribose 1-methylphosphonate 5-triphosphate synthase subunit PhnH
VAVLNHLPVRYRIVVWVAGLVACAGVGGWIAFATQVPLEWQSGAAIGVVLGGLAVSSFLRALEGATSDRPDGPHQVV